MVTSGTDASTDGKGAPVGITGMYDGRADGDTERDADALSVPRAL